MAAKALVRDVLTARKLQSSHERNARIPAAVTNGAPYYRTSRTSTRGDFVCGGIEMALLYSIAASDPTPLTTCYCKCTSKYSEAPHWNALMSLAQTITLEKNECTR